MFKTYSVGSELLTSFELNSRDIVIIYTQNLNKKNLQLQFLYGKSMSFLSCLVIMGGK